MEIPIKSDTNERLRKLIEREMDGLKKSVGGEAEDGLPKPLRPRIRTVASRKVASLPGPLRGVLHPTDPHLSPDSQNSNS